MENTTAALAAQQDRIFTFTDGRSAYFMGGSHSFNTAAHFGWNIAERHFLRDWNIFADGKLLERKTAREFYFEPHALRRVYAGGETETFFMADGESILCCLAEGDFSSAAFEVHTALNVEKIIAGEPERLMLIDGKILGLKAVKLAGGALFVAAAGETPDDISRLLSLAAKGWQELSRTRKLRLENVRGIGSLSCGARLADEALLWSRLSLDSLVMRGEMNGIWAGLPWFNNFWGRDTFISLPGAALVNGDFKTARALLLGFAKFQFTDSSSQLLGRIPNIITGGKPYYNTADGSKWFIIAALKYLQYSGDREFCRKIFPVIERALEGALAKRTGPDFLLQHGDAETWMDAVGPAGPWSPRGDRAVEIQALWHAVLLCGEKFALCVGEEGKALRWRLLAGEVKKSFSKKFTRGDGTLYDHLNADGSPDGQMRPNQIFAVTCAAGLGLEQLLSPATAVAVSRAVTQELVLAQGVMSLSPKDANFHPFHDYPAYPHKDAAYHNGIIWTWLAGPVIEALCLHGQQNLAWRLFSEEARQIMQDGCLGGFSELREACPRPGASAAIPSGTVNQAWNLAEFQRNFIENFIGWRPFAQEGKAILSPALPDGVARFEAALPYAAGMIEFTAERKDGATTITLCAQNIDGEINIACPAAGQNIILSRQNKSAVLALRPEQKNAPWHFAPPVFC